MCASLKLKAKKIKSFQKSVNIALKLKRQALKGFLNFLSTMIFFAKLQQLKIA